MKLPLDNTTDLRVRFRLPNGYPTNTRLECEASSDAFSRQQHSAISSLVLKCSTQMPQFNGRECVFDMLQTIKDGALELITSCNMKYRDGVGESEAKESGRLRGVGASQNEAEELCCLKLDHMRDERRYIKAIRSWTRDLGLTGR